tara:strand:+ start:92 stop:286 length:195 start_codon:yes stop_codon:yes gene_type:complete
VEDDWQEKNKVVTALEWLGVMLFIALAMNMVAFVYIVKSISLMPVKMGRICAKIARKRRFSEDK